MVPKEENTYHKHTKCAEMVTLAYDSAPVPVYHQASLITPVSSSSFIFRVEKIVLNYFIITIFFISLLKYLPAAVLFQNTQLNTWES